MFSQCFVRKDSSGTNFNQISTKFVLKDPVTASAEINPVVYPKDVKVSSSGVIPIKPDTPVALDAAVHLVIYKRPQILIQIGPLFEPISPIYMTGHYRHVLKMTFSAFITDRAIVGMVDHQPFNNPSSKLPDIVVIN